MRFIPRYRLLTGIVATLFSSLVSFASVVNDLPDWALGPFTRPQSAQPIIKPNEASRFDCPLAGHAIAWEMFHTFNPAAVVHNGRIVVLYRAEGGEPGGVKKGLGGYTSRLGLAVSEDGLNFITEPKPTYYPANDDQKQFEWSGGAEDPRLVTSPDGTYILVFTQYQGKGPTSFRLGIASSKDLHTWTKHGSPFAGTPFENRGCKSASILQKVEGDRLIAAKVNGKYWMYFGEHAVSLASSDDLIHWTALDDGKGSFRQIMKSRQGYFDSGLTECGPPALLTDKGILLIYNGKNRSGQAGDTSLKPNVYSCGQALFDRNDPATCITRLDKPFFQPALDWETSGQYKAGTTFAEGLVLWKGRWFLYYGCADTFVGVATAPISGGTAIAGPPVTEPAANYDETKVPKYTLPDPLLLSNGQRVTDAASWRDRRREIVALFEKYVYGKAPGRPKGMTFEPGGVADALDCKAVRKEVTIRFSQDAKGPKIHLLIYLPKGAKGPVPVFLALNFHGNHAICNDPGVTLTDAWMANDPARGVTENRATESGRGTNRKQWALDAILARGYGVATAYYGDIEPDFKDGIRLGVRSLFLNDGLAQPETDEWGAIAAWGWGLSRIMDYLQTDRDIDGARVALMGHSRLGKAAIWAGARDERFAVVISNDSGCGGAALARRGIGETVGRINNTFPHWFCGNFKQFNARVDELPVDQHLLLSLVAPRPLYVASAEEDRWADPHGEFLSAKAAEAVYRLLGAGGLPCDRMPPVEQPVMGRIGYHIRHGVHDVTDYDWQQYLDFCTRELPSPNVK